MLPASLLDEHVARPATLRWLCLVLNTVGFPQEVNRTITTGLKMVRCASSVFPPDSIILPASELRKRNVTAVLPAASRTMPWVVMHVNGPSAPPQRVRRDAMRRQMP